MYISDRSSECSSHGSICNKVVVGVVVVELVVVLVVIVAIYNEVIVACDVACVAWM